MAYKKRVVVDCYNSYCPKEGRWEVFDRWNSSHGKFCHSCGTGKVKELNDAEIAFRGVRRPSRRELYEQ